MVSASQQPGYLDTVSGIYKNEGMRGFVKGWRPPFFGSIIYRSIQFTVYEMVFTASEKNKSLKQVIPYSGGLEYRVALGGFVSGSVRSLVECPFEYAKVKQQTGQKWVIKDVFKGYNVLYPRTTLIMTTYFSTIDTLRRKTDLWQYRYGQFLITGGAAGFGMILAWPFEVLKNLAQAENLSSGSTVR